MIILKNKPNGRHAANNTNVKRCIDFAAEQWILSSALLGWNRDGKIGLVIPRIMCSTLLNSYPDFDVPDI